MDARWLFVLALTSCSALAWLAEPACPCPGVDAPTHADLLVDDATTIGSIFTGPGGTFVLGLAGQVAHAVIGSAVGRRRKNQKGPPP